LNFILPGFNGAEANLKIKKGEIEKVDEIAARARFTKLLEATS